MEKHVSVYLSTVALINASVGAALAIGLYFAGMPNPVLWGVMAGLLIFVPYVGPLIGIAIVAAVSFLTFETIGRAIIPPAIYMVIEFMQGNVITPMILGMRFELNPVAIFIWLIFWGWMWGVVGALLAVPMLTIFKIFCDHTESLTSIGEFLGK